MIRRMLLAATALVALTSSAFAQADYPIQTITMIVPFAAGGSTDTVGRLIAEPMTKKLGQQMIDRVLAYDLLRQQQPLRAAREYLGILHLAAKQSESGVEAALQRLLDEECPLSVAAVAEELRQSDTPMSLTEVVIGAVDLASYDALLSGKEAADVEGREGAAAGAPEGAAPASVPAWLRGAGAAGPAGGLIFEQYLLGLAQRECQERRHKRI